MAVHVQIVANPDAGSYKSAKIQALRDAFARAGATSTVSFMGPGRQLLIEDTATLLCVAGGDGTVRHAAEAVLRSTHKPPIAAYPMGTINLLQREMGALADPDGFVAAALRGKAPAVHHPVELGDTIFLGCASVGPDSIAVANVSRRLKRAVGRYAYGIAMIRQLARWPRPNLVIIADGKRHKCAAVYVAKGMYFAGPWSFAPQARRATPKLHVVALRDASPRRYVQFIRNVTRGRPLDARDNLISLTCTTLAIESDAPWPVQADGDDVGTLPVRMTIHNETLRIL
jgi:diacylglycerol kinase (ATP)